MMNNNTSKGLNTDELAAVAGGDGLRDHPMYSILKECYVKKGKESAMALGLYYGLNNEEVMAMLKSIGEEVARDNNNCFYF